MNTSINCPDALLLQQFLDGSQITDASQTWTRERVEEHVNQCESCQHSIERLVAGQESWEGAAKQLAQIDAAQSGSSVETPALRQLIDHEKDRVQGSVNGGTRVGDDIDAELMSLDFLQPSDQPDSRGRIGSYEILDVVGRGGMGLVLKAYDTSLRRIVAIKVMAAHLASCAAARRRFSREARAAAAVSHDHVVAIYAVEENHEPPFLAMQFIGGKTLQERLTASGPLAVNEVLRIGMQTAHGLAAAHSQGLVHRDIKPANILLENGVERVKITDFGLARAIDDVGMTQTGVVAGTPQYMAPEQANGEAIDVRSDLFSLGSVMYTLCTGRPPFRATTTMGLLKRICEETPRPIRDLNPDIPEWLDAIIAKLLKKNPADRYQTAKEVAELLSGWLAHVQRPTTVPAPTSVPEPRTVPVQGANADSFAVERKNETQAVDGKSDAESAASNSASDSLEPPVSIDGSTSLFLMVSQWISGNYSRTIAFKGDSSKAFDLAVATLSAAGFTLNRRSASQLTLTGPGLNRLRGSVLANASTVELSRSSRGLTLEANMGTLRSFHAFLLSLVAITFLFVFVIRPYTPAAAPNPVGVIFLGFLALLVGTSIVFGRRTIHTAFDVLLGNLAQTGIVDGDGPGASMFEKVFSVEELDQRRKLGWIYICWAIAATALLDAFLLWQHFWRFYSPGFLEIIPVSSILVGLPLALAIYKRYVKQTDASSRRETRVSFADPQGNLAKTGMVDRAQSVNTAEAGSSALARFRQRVKNACPSRACWILIVIWSAFMIPLTDAMGTIPFPALHWIVVGYVALGLIVPAAVIGYAWWQKRGSGNWQSTVLRDSPWRLFTNLQFSFFLASVIYWGWQQAACGIVTFDIDDKSFIVSLTDTRDLKSTPNYSADFYALRLRAGKYYWGVKHGSTVIAGGEFVLPPGGQHEIRVRSPYPLHQANMAFLPGRWKLSYGISGRSRLPRESDGVDPGYIDIRSNEISVHSPQVASALDAMLGAAAARRAASISSDRVYLFDIPNLPVGERNQWIDISVTSKSSQVTELVAHGIFAADANTFTMNLAPVTSPRPKGWEVGDDKSVMLFFARADDWTLLQGEWGLAMKIGEIDVPIQIAFHGNVMTSDVSADWTGDSILNLPIDSKLRTLTIYPTKEPKRITLSSHQENGVVHVSEGIYRIDGDRLTLSFGNEGRIPGDFEGNKIELQRAKP